ncbi:conserved hypothetical protein [Nitrospina gracilis 3/211]|uniref:Fructosamine kinase n=1 Tax=Nitrospina gracilis (strain 3/211) TaxID=1266370 RepID=M1ZED6_NITG3|nr:MULTISPECIES: fructosamine kinase family protein [Nitrospina]MCF8722494.1 fructosamine-3-kinase [Nitrospina sp. Nb-3]CCQ91924.1 conserved hypothetical protein [Nitrospina gracilis 3/211]
MKNELHGVLKTAYGQPVEIRNTQSIGGGCINETLLLTLSNGDRVFVKHNGQPPPDFFAREADALRLMGRAKNGPRVPQVIGLPEEINPRYLLLEYIEPGTPNSDFHERFSRGLAGLHHMSHQFYGFDRDNYIGSTVQVNKPETDPLVFFREHRLRFQQELARKRGLLPTSVDQRLDLLLNKLHLLMDLEGEKPALLHGDLWSGNYFADRYGTPCIFDPASYFGLREADLAMTELFGRLPQRFYDAYHEVFPLNPGYENRKQIFNLYHLLNHLNLFGSSYLSSVKAVVNRFV